MCECSDYMTFYGGAGVAVNSGKRRRTAAGFEVVPGVVKSNYADVAGNCFLWFFTLAWNVFAGALRT